MIRSLTCKMLIVLAVAFCQSGAHATEPVESLDDIEFWVGTGANRAAIAIDWNGESSTDEALVWGYHWDGSAVARDALQDTLSADSRLYAKLGTVAGLGTAVVGVGYDDNDDDLFELTDNTVFDSHGINVSNLSDGESSADAGDQYAEGWFLGYWHLGFTDETPVDDPLWTSAITGVDGLALADNRWISLAFTTDTFSTNEFAENLLAAPTPTNSADFDVDDDIDGTDFLVWQRGLGTTFDVLDFQAWSGSYGTAGAFSALRSVPEPTTCSIFVLGLFTFLAAENCNLRRTTWRSI